MPADIPVNGPLQAAGPTRYSAFQRFCNAIHSDRQPAIAFNWKKLPRPLRFIGPMAERYGQIQSEEAQEEFAASATDAQRAELGAIAECVQEYQADFMLWGMDHGFEEHPESKRIYFLMRLLGTMRLI